MVSCRRWGHRRSEEVLHGFLEALQYTPEDDTNLTKSHTSHKSYLSSDFHANSRLSLRCSATGRTVRIHIRTSSPHQHYSQSGSGCSEMLKQSQSYGIILLIDATLTSYISYSYKQHTHHFFITRFICMTACLPNLIGQLEGNISLYCPLVIACAYRDARVPIETRKSYNKSIIAIPWVGQYGEIFRSQPRYRPSLRPADTVDLKQNLSLYCPQ